MSDLPTFLIIGAAKSGTTSLYRYLGKHPEVFVTPEKEPNFFAFEGETVSFRGPGDERCNRRSITSLTDYKQLFINADAPARGEASPSSLYFPQAPPRISQYVPDAKIIVILRNPVDRAYSNFLTMITQGYEPCHDFATALNREDERLERGWSFFWGYRRLGFYYEQLSRYYEQFPSNQIHVCLFRDLTDDPFEMLQKIFRFLDIDSSFRPASLKRHNASGVPKSSSLHWLLYHAGLRPTVRNLLPHRLVRYLSSNFSEAAQRLRDLKMKLLHRNLDRPTMSPSVRQRLRSLYREDILRLQDLIDRDLSHWLDAPDSVK